MITEYLKEICGLSRKPDLIKKHTKIVYTTVIYKTLEEKFDL